MHMRVGTHTPVRSLDRLTTPDAARAGGKAANCARLKQAGFPVPDGLVILADAGDDAVAAIAGHEWFDEVPPGTLFAVRSSGIGEDGVGQSFAGVHETFLNVARADLAAAAAACRASARAERALAYRRANHLPVDAIAIGVLIQRMIQPAAAGVAFTVNPVTGAAGELVVNAAPGLGEALVNGAIDPDEYIVRKRDGRLLAYRPAGRSADLQVRDSADRRDPLGRSADLQVRLLSDAALEELSALLVRIERHYGAPQDVEWCHDGERFWIVQSRPVTAAAAGGADIEWTRANLAEVLPDETSPQALAALEEMLNRAERMALGRMVGPSDTLGPTVKAFRGRLYFNLSQLRRICAFAGYPPAVMLKSLGHAGEISPEDEIARRAPIGELLAAVPDIARLVFRHLTAARVVRRHAARHAASLAALQAREPARLSDREIWAEIENWRGEAPEYMQTVLLLGGVLFWEAPVRALCESVGFPFEQLLYPQLAAGERSVSSQQAFDLVALAAVARREPAAAGFLATAPTEALAGVREALAGTEFLAAFDRYLARYGHRGRYESDWALPRYAEDPTPLLVAVRAHLQSGAGADPAGLAARQEREAADAWAAFVARLPWWRRLVSLPRARRAVATIKRYYVWREQVRSDLVRVVAVLRTWHLTLAGRFVERGWLDARDDYFLIRLPEIAAVVEGREPPDSLRRIAASRRAQVERDRPLRMPLLMKEADLPLLLRAADGVEDGPSGAGPLTGLPVSRGVVEGQVVVVRDPADFDQMTRGAILVAPATDPSWTPLFTLASGVIVEIGGVLSHASTIAREFGLPALANVRHATTRLRTGDRVRLDAVAGVVERL